MHSRTFFFTGLAVGLIVVISISLTVFTGPYQFQGSVIQTPSPAADFLLIDQNGNPFKLSDQHGKYLLIFFGFTHCKDVCPQTLAQFRQIDGELGNQASQVEFVFITVDPERDTAERIKTYLNSFDPEFIGLTGEQSTLEQVWKTYGIYVAKSTDSHGGDYEVDHTARIYLVDQAGNLKITYPAGFATDKIVQDLKNLVKEGADG